MSDYDDKQFNVEFQALTLRWIYSEGLDDSWDLMTWMVMLLAGLALPAMPPQQLALSAGNGSSEVEVVSFQQVWGRSYCRALEKLVDVLSEYPDEVEHMFNPSCVSLLRCSGCCGDENLHCMPVETANVTMQSHKAQRKNLRFRGVISLAQRVEEPRSHRGLSDSRAGPPSCTIAVLAALGEEGHTGARPVCPPLRAE
ncbi:placenta growth factor isoform X9 [Canis lupus dingo]|uniref:placenta growth factor isoform X9 n=1 Tax=Canis lupus dingo TaxID=286419 RepID=UPI0020C47AA2|nr:placenta growth factor isoform X9 [Canis lupus dingo]